MQLIIKLISNIIVYIRFIYIYTLISRLLLSGILIEFFFVLCVRLGRRELLRNYSAAQKDSGKSQCDARSSSGLSVLRGFMGVVSVYTIVFFSGLLKIQTKIETLLNICHWLLHTYIDLYLLMVICM